ncbi:hypothetical protein KAU13_00755, partial [candidate division WOR-3 bacterium]|nr:hypothetical protein [candidate division WOR-3 bacterium]
MAIARMTKISIALHSSHKEELLKHLQDESALHITKIEEESAKNDYETSDGERIRQLESQLSHLDDTIKFVQNFIKQGGFLSGLIPQKVPVLKEKFEDTVKNFDFEKITERIKTVNVQLSKLRSEKDHLTSKKEIIEPWLNLSTPVELLKNTATSSVLAGTVNKRYYKDEMLKKAEEVGIEIEKIDESKNESYLIVVFHKSNEEEAKDFLDEINFSLEDFRGFEGKPSDILKRIQIRIHLIEEESENLIEQGKEFVGFHQELL